MNETKRYEILGLINKIAARLLDQLVLTMDRQSSEEFGRQARNVLTAVLEGIEQKSSDQCVSCRGTGAYATGQSPSFGRYVVTPHVCSDCGGSGRKKH
jgi:hypothetical protein